MVHKQYWLWLRQPNIFLQCIYIFLLKLNAKKLCAEDRLCNFCKSSVLVKGLRDNSYLFTSALPQTNLKTKLISNLPYLQIPELHLLH